MIDFTLKSYKSLIVSFLQEGYCFQTFEDFLQKPVDSKVIVLRHDVDELAGNALKIAKLEHSLGVRSTFFFRIVKQSNQPDVIRQIVEMGHAVGYHYEDLSFAEGDFEKAIQSFETNLNYFRTYYPVKVICMHGSSSSKYDNRLLWKKYKMADYGIIGEPYLSLDFDRIYYLTDTGYAWDGGKYAVRDVVVNTHGLQFHTTKQIVDCIHKGEFPSCAMILAHTLWTDSILQWTWLHLREFLRNNIKHLAQKSGLVSKLYGGLVNRYWKKSK